jgi:hypothetical protein
VFGQQSLASGPVDLDGDVRRAERLSRRAGHGQQLLLGPVRPLEPLGQAGDDAVRVLALSQHQPADQPPQPVPQRRVHGGDDEQRQQGRLALGQPLAEQGARRAHDGEVDGDDAGGERGVQQRAAKESVDVHEVRAGDACGDGCAGRAHGHGEADRGELARQRPAGEHHEQVDDRGPQQPPHPRACLAAGSAVAADDDGERDDEAQRHERVGGRQYRRPDGVGQRQAGRVEVQAAQGYGERAAGLSLGDRGWHGEEDDGQHARAQQAGQRGGSPATRRQAAVGVEQQDERERQQERGTQALEDPERQSRAGQRGLVPGRVRQPGRRRPVEAPHQAGCAQDPGHGVARSAG